MNWRRQNGRFRCDFVPITAAGASAAPGLLGKLNRPAIVDDERTLKRQAKKSPVKPGWNLAWPEGGMRPWKGRISNVARQIMDACRRMSQNSPFLMIADPSVVIDELIHRITSIVLRTYEVEQLLPADNIERLSLARYELVSAVSIDTGRINFSCALLLKADERRSSFLVKVRGQAGYETPIWHINEIYDVAVDPLDRGDSGFAGLE